jgi:hypothetical protein
MSIIHTNNPRLSPKNVKRDFKRREEVANLLRELKALEKAKVENIDVHVGKIVFLKKRLEKLLSILKYNGYKQYGASVGLSQGQPKEPMAYPEAAKKGMLWSK